MAFEKENIHYFKRFYLLISLLFSMFIPLITINITFLQPVEEIHQLYTGSYFADFISGDKQPFHEQPLKDVVSQNNRSPSVSLIKIIYWIISFIYLLRLVRNSISLWYSAKRGRRIVEDKRIIVLVKERITPYSFCNHIYVYEEDYINGYIAEEIIAHEQAHVNQKHSLDILFIELLITFCWFNPVLYMFRKKIKENHEFLADQAVLKRADNIAGYQNILINTITNKESMGLASQINYSTIKKRFIMMKKQTSRKKARRIKMISIPAIFAAICIFSSQPINGNQLDSVGDYKANEKSQSKDNYVIPEKGISDDLLEEYQQIVDKYIAEKTDGKVRWKSTNVSSVDRERLYILYVQMNKDQRSKQWMHLRGPFNPIKYRKPNKDEWNGAKRANTLIINGEKAELKDLNAYTRQDVYLFHHSYIDEKKENYQYAFWTKDKYEEYIKLYKDGIPLEVFLEIAPQIWFWRDRNSKI